MVLDDAAIISFLVIENADEAIRLGHFLNGFAQIPQTIIGIFRRGALKVSRDDLQFFAENSLGDFMHPVHSRMDLFCSASTHRTADKQFFHSILLRTALQEQALRTERSAPHTGQHQHPAQRTSHRRTDCTRQGSSSSQRDLPAGRRS